MAPMPKPDPTIEEGNAAARLWRVGDTLEKQVDRLENELAEIRKLIRSAGLEIDEPPKTKKKKKAGRGD